MGQREMPDDLVGRRFGRLVVIEYRMEIRSPGDQEKLYLCKCDCGNEKWANRKGLISGSTKSCGCYRKETSAKRSKDRRKDLTGKRFGKLLVERYLDDRGKDNVARWLCKCDCGTYKIVNGRSLSGGCSNSCGCLQKESAKTRRGKKAFVDLAGMKFGKLTVIRRDESKPTSSKDTAVYWICKCDCGNKKVVRGGDLKSGYTKSCGCIGLESIIAVELKEYCSNNYSAIPEYKEFRNPETGYYLPYDIFIPRYSFYIEVHGPQHYIYFNNWFGSIENFEYRQHKDRIKKEYAEQHGTFIEIDLRKIKTTEEAIKYVESFIK
jgi:hypothetical protein